MGMSTLLLFEGGDRGGQLVDLRLQLCHFLGQADGSPAEAAGRPGLFLFEGSV